MFDDLAVKMMLFDTEVILVILRFRYEFVMLLMLF